MAAAGSTPGATAPVVPGPVAPDIGQPGGQPGGQALAHGQAAAPPAGDAIPAGASIRRNRRAKSSAACGSAATADHCSCHRSR